MPPAARHPFRAVGRIPGRTAPGRAPADVDAPDCRSVTNKHTGNSGPGSATHLRQRLHRTALAAPVDCSADLPRAVQKAARGVQPTSGSDYIGRRAAPVDCSADLPRAVQTGPFGAVLQAHYNRCGGELARVRPTTGNRPATVVPGRTVRGPTGPLLAFPFTRADSARDPPSVGPGGRRVGPARDARAVLGLPRVPPAAAGRDPRQPQWPRQRGRAADRGRQVAVLPDAGPRGARRRGRPRRVSADLADEGPGGRPGGERGVGRRPQRLDHAGRTTPGVRRPRRRALPAAVRHAGAARRRGRRGFPGPAANVGRPLRRGRRGALHQPVGA